MALSDLLQSMIVNHDIRSMLQGWQYCYIIAVSDFLEQPCNNKQIQQYQQCCYKLLASCFIQHDNLGQLVGAQLVDSLLADVLQDVSFLRV
jgi:hypothetical protein